MLLNFQNSEDTLKLSTTSSRYLISSIIKNFPYTVATCSPLADIPEPDDIELEDEVKELLLDLLIEQTKIDILEQDGSDDDMDEVLDVIIQEWSLMCQEREGIKGGERVWRLGCEVISLCDLSTEERANLIALTSGLERLRLLRSILKIKIGETKITAGSGWDLQVSESGDVPKQALSLNVGQKVEYYWNEEYEWQPATVVNKIGPVGGEVLFDLKFDSDGEVHRCGFGFEDRGRWRPV
ncbi:hypothetical protein TrLO_g13530 [Triparma laevis f. longispina]|uniref:Uncharacterized protein n=1 Tax=Triparma laevis f. longispina TaxID=1714387 RepID=A0A9W7FS95_9STRA|nr:hypothetical protein TrLO_g13530 [Triparma laevis f. longispina]